MTTPEYIAKPKDHPAHRGNTYATGCDRPWYPATPEYNERADKLLELRGSLIGALAISKGLLSGSQLGEYQTTIECMLKRIMDERRAILEGCK